MLEGNLKKKCEFLVYINILLSLSLSGLGTYISSRGRVIKELGLRRTDLVISTKIFWGPRTGPNDRGLSRKQYVLAPISPSMLKQRNLFTSIIEGTQESLARLGLDYVDIIFAHRHDYTGMQRSINKMLSFLKKTQCCYYQ